MAAAGGDGAAAPPPPGLPFAAQANYAPFSGSTFGPQGTPAGWTPPGGALAL